MTPYSHAFTGFAVGFMLAPLTQQGGVSRRQTVILSTLGALAPDIDAIWLFINKANYTSRAWYGHHGATHSILGALLLGSLLAAVFFMIESGISRFLKKDSAGVLQKDVAWKGLLIMAGVACLGALLHLPGDLVTLSGIWGGLPLGWPFVEVRTPALGLLPWRDYFIIIISCAGFLILPLLALLERGPVPRFILSLPAALLAIAIVVFYLMQLPPYWSAAVWKQQQRELVGVHLFRFAQRIESRYIWPLWR